jgi:hypothetical protein
MLTFLPNGDSLSVRLETYQIKSCVARVKLPIRFQYSTAVSRQLKHVGRSIFEVPFGSPSRLPKEGDCITIHPRPAQLTLTRESHFSTSSPSSATPSHSRPS